jgi:FkbM family methyltransferase
MPVMKKALKRSLIPVAKAVGRRLPTPQSRAWFCDRLIPYLMDPDVLPAGLVERPTRHFGVSILCDPYVYVHRDGYWCGVFFEEEVEAYLHRELKPGDTVIDVGMNVGERGKVIAFEPNTELVRCVQSLADSQGLKQIAIMPFGLGAIAGTFDLRMEPEHAGGATFRSASTDDAFSVRMRCEVKVGDEVLRDQNFVGRVFLKMDVEGFEIQALEGLEDTLSKVDHAIIEVSPEWLNDSGVKKLFELMSDRGLSAYELEISGESRRAVAQQAVKAQTNIVFKRQTKATLRTA